MRQRPSCAHSTNMERKPFILLTAAIRLLQRVFRSNLIYSNLAMTDHIYGVSSNLEKKKQKFFLPRKIKNKKFKNHSFDPTIPIYCLLIPTSPSISHLKRKINFFILYQYFTFPLSFDPSPWSYLLSSFQNREH